MEIVYRETRELVRLKNGNYMVVVKKFGKHGQQLDWEAVLVRKAGDWEAEYVV